MRLKDKVIIVTGSTTGIGEAIARAVVAEGGRVLIHGLERELGENVVASLGAGNAVLHTDDLTDAAAPQRIVAAALAAFGRIDGIVNNAAFIPRSNIDTTDAALFDRCMAVNVRAPFLLIKAALEPLKLSRGCVLNIGSVNGLCGEANLMAYSVSKGALQTLSRNLADSLSSLHVRVNHFVLGWVLSENEKKYKIADGLPADWYEHPPQVFVPTGKMTQPADIAAAAMYWISDQSKPFSGCVVELSQYPMIGRTVWK